MEYKNRYEPEWKKEMLWKLDSVFLSSVNQGKLSLFGFWNRESQWTFMLPVWIGQGLLFYICLSVHLSVQNIS